MDHVFLQAKEKKELTNMEKKKFLDKVSSKFQNETIKAFLRHFQSAEMDSYYCPNRIDVIVLIITIK